MALKVTHKETEFAIGDKVKVAQRIKEGDKERTQVFEGIVLAIKGRGGDKMFIVRKMGAGGVGVERIFPLFSPTIEKITVVKKGHSGAKRAKLYYVRKKAPREIEKIYSRTFRKVS